MSDVEQDVGSAGLMHAIDRGKGSVTDLDRDENTPHIRITDKRRFSNIDSQEALGDEAGASSGVAAEAPDDLAAARQEAAGYLEHLQRLQAEFDNYRKRVLKEQTQAVELAAQPTMRRLLEVLDDFELALIHASEKPDFDRFLHGVELVYAKLMDALKAEGMQRIDAQGKPFDP